jgi:hypothetical protein
LPGCDAKPSLKPEQASNEQELTARFLASHDWIDKGIWLKVDFHVHSRFSDGAFDIPLLVERAAQHECDAIAITDHGDYNLRAASPEYFHQLETARRLFPNIMVLAGLEWNVPPHNGVEHATVLVEPGSEEQQLLAEFKSLFDDYERELHPPERAEEALRWLEAKASAAGQRALIIYNHPNRKRGDPEAFPNEFRRLQRVSRLLVGFEGAPGHQATEPFGAYLATVQVVDRWDPAVATLGGAWDRLLLEGADCWAAFATSDFHAPPPDGIDYFPGEFSETWVYAPDRTPKGLLRAMAAGYFFGVHGRIARQVDLKIDVDGLPRPARAGETIAVRKGAVCEVSLSMEAGPNDSAEFGQAIDVVELIGISREKTQIWESFEFTSENPVIGYQVTVPEGGIVVRARGRRRVGPPHDLMFVTNPVRIVATNANSPAAVQPMAATK